MQCCVLFHVFAYVSHTCCGGQANKESYVRIVEAAYGSAYTHVYVYIPLNDVCVVACVIE